MNLSNDDLWARFKQYHYHDSKMGLSVDISRMNFGETFFEEMEPAFERAFDAMRQLEAGAEANPDEGRQVGHYWLRNSALAPSEAYRAEIDSTFEKIQRFAEKILSGETFSNLLVVGIGGSALGPQFVEDALYDSSGTGLRSFYLDNTDPDGMQRVLKGLLPEISNTLTVVISKSGGTKETRNGMLEAKKAYESAGLSFSEHAVAVTGEGSELFNVAKSEGWMEIFPMWEWVGGRTSETSAVGLLPASLQGIDIKQLIRGSKECDEVTRRNCVKDNPAALLAAMWYYATDGIGSKDMVILPYKDRLGLFSKYLQQLVMESLGKEFDLDGNVVNQGIAVYGNKGSTDQHAYVQQLREGMNNFFVTFIEVLEDCSTEPVFVEPSTTSGDYLSGFYLGTRSALHEKGRESLTVTVERVDAYTVGALIALYERAVGFYASLVGINAYHQPGVEAGKKAAGEVIDLQRQILALIREHGGRQWSVDDLSDELDLKDHRETIFLVARHLSANPWHGVKAEKSNHQGDWIFTGK